MKKFLLASLLVLFAAMMPLSVMAEGEIVEPPTIFEPEWSASGVQPGGEIVLACIYTIARDHHLTDPMYGLLYVDLQLPEGVTVTDTTYSEGETEEGETVFRGSMAVYVHMKVDESVKPGSYPVKYDYSFQICRDIEPKSCFLPNGGSGETTMTILASGEKAIASSNPLLAEFAGEVESGQSSGKGLEGKLTNALEGGSFVAFLLVFAAGVLVSFTPCVYPMIPIIIGFVGGSAGGSRFKGFILSLFFVLGLSIMYAILGVVAGATGALFGSFMQNPIVLTVIVAIFIALGTSMLGAFDIALPASIQGKLMGGQRQGIIGAILIGAVTGIVAAPCAGPPLLVLLGWIGNSGNLVLGFFLMAVFALGIGALFIVIGTFAGAMSALPRAGTWMNTIKKGLGVMIFAVALYYLKFLLPVNIVIIISGGFMLSVGLFMGATAKWEELETSGKYGKALGTILFVAGIFYLLMGLAKLHDINLSGGGQYIAAGGEAVAEENHVPWRVNEYDAVLADAASSNTPVIVDFYADWCGVCVELDHNTWNKQAAIEASKNYIPLKLDFTKSTPELEALRKKHNIGGLPTVIILGPDGVERSRFSEFRTAEEVAAWMDKYK